MNCERCGATVEDGAFCKHCGARVLKPKDLGTDTHTSPERFDLAKAHASFALASAHTPRVSAKAEIVAPIVFSVFLVFFVVFSQTMMTHVSIMFRIFFLAIPGVGFVMMLAMLRKGMTFAAAPITNELRVVVDERTAVSGGGQNSSVSTTYYATLQDRSGGRVEYQTYDWLAGRIAAGDIGVAYLKGVRLVDFARIDV
jgi:hypothetical protein